MPKIFSLILSLFPILLAAQNGKMYSSNERGPYLYVYQLNEVQAKFAVEHSNHLDSQILYTKEVLRIPTDSIYTSRKRYSQLLQNGEISPTAAKQMGLKQHGYYLVANIVKPGDVRLFLRELPYFNVSLYQVDKEYAIFVSDTSGTHVGNADVFLDDEVCKYDPSLGGYLVKNKFLTGKITIRRGNHFLIKHVYSNTKIKNKTKPARDNYNYNKQYDGYIVTNKPIYKMGDTIFWKAFLIKPNAKGFKRKLEFKLHAYSYGKKNINEIRTVKCDERGAYHGFYVVADSFTENINYSLTATIPGLDQLKSISIRVENYDLNDIVMEAKSQKPIYQPGEDVKILVKTLDKNQLPLLDARLNCRFWIKNIDYTESDSVQIPNSKFLNFYTLKIQTNANGMTEIIIPADSFVNAQAVYGGEVILTTSDNRTLSKRITFTTSTERDRSEIYRDNDSLYIKHYFNQKLVKKTFTIETHGEKYLIADSEVTSPIVLPLTANIDQIKVSRDGKVVFQDKLNRPFPEITGKRTFDSVYISFKTKEHSRVYYRIYQNNSLKASGNDTVLNYAVKDLSKHSYHIQYAILQNHVIQPHLFSQSFHLAEKKLLIDIKQPKEIYPGQKVDVELHVTNVKKKPMKKVNLTAYAINAQIPGIVDPTIPYLGKVKDQKILPTKPVSLGYCGFQKGMQLKSWMVEQFALRDNLYYQLVFPKNGFTVLSDTIADSITQVQLFVSKGAHPENIIISTNKGKIIYSDNYGGYSDPFLVEGKTVSLIIRTKEHLITLPSIEIKDFQKNFIAIQIDSLPEAMVSKKEKVLLFHDSLQALLANHALAFRFSPRIYDSLLIYINRKLVKAYPGSFSSGQKSGYRPYSPYILFKGKQVLSARGRRNTAKNDQYYLYGPVDSGDVIEMRYKNHYGHEFTYKSSEFNKDPNPHSTYTLTKYNKTIHQRNMNSLMLIQNRDNQFTHYQQLRKIWFNAFPKPVPPDTTKKYKRPMWTPPSYNLNKYQYKGFTADYRKFKKKKKDQVNFNFITDFRQVDKIWLFDVTDSSLSHMRSYRSNGQYYWQINKTKHSVSFTSDKINRNHKYAVFIQSTIDTVWAIKRFTIDTMSCMYYVFDSSEIRNLTGGEYFAIDRMAKILGRTPMKPFLDTANLGEISIDRLATKDKSTLLEGLVIGPNIQYPVYNAFIVLEQNGYFKHGAWTNADGRFIIDNLSPGTYMLKIKAENYHYWLHYSLQISAGKNHLALIKLKPYASMRYDNMVYEKGEDYDLMEASEDAVFSNSNVTSGAYYSSPESIQMSPKRSLSGLVKTNASINGISVRGSRTDNIAVYKAEKGKSVSYAFNFGDGDMDDTDGYFDTERRLEISRDTLQLSILANDPQATRTRTIFRDYAYWIPNLRTNKKGIAKFTVTYPDNVTTWINYFPAMDNCRHSALGKYIVKSYKPITTRLYFPKFLTEGDVLKTKTMVANYTKVPVVGKFYYNLNGVENITSMTLENYFNKTIELEPAILGKQISLETGFKLNNGYIDAEKRSLSIKPATVVTGVSDFRDLVNDTAFSLKWQKDDIESWVTFYNSKLHSAMALFNDLELFYYSDNQTQINLLEAYLIKEKLSKQLDLDKDYSATIKRFVKTVSGSQNILGWFGYFKTSSFQNIFLTARMAEVLYKADLQGYENNAYYNACTWMTKQLNRRTNEERVAILYALEKCNRKTNYKNELARINPDQLTTSGKLRYQYLEQKILGRTKTDEIKSMLATTPLGNVQVPATYYQGWCRPYFDASNNTFLAWEVLYASRTESQTRKALIEAMMERSYGNAYSKALAIQAFVTEYTLGENKNFIPDLNINSKKLVAKDYPATYEIRKDEELKVDKKGVQVYMVSNRSFKTYNPVSDLKEFSINTRIGKLDSTVYHLETATNFTLTVNVLAKTNQGEVVIDVPIPAGCTYGAKMFGERYNEVHREYKDDRVIIYLSQMDFGNHTFHIPLRSLFKGTFNTAPARVSQMDYSDKASYSERKKFIIAD